MGEITPIQESKAQIALNEQSLLRGEKLNVAELIEFAKRGLVTRYQVEEAEAIDGIFSETLQTSIPLSHSNEGYTKYEYPEQIALGSKEINSLWPLLAGPGTGFVPVNGLINIYKSGYGFTIHKDMGGLLPEQGDPAEALTFLYVLSGSKDLVFYDDLKGSNELLRITQRPGELYVFQGGDYGFADGSKSEALFHGVPPQDTNNITLTWELTR